MGHPQLPSFESIWHKHEQAYLEVFILSLERLSTQNSLTGYEDALSERLADISKDICFELGKKRGIEIKRPCWEMPKQPTGIDEMTGGKKGKRPDFTCSCINPNATQSKEWEIYFHVECKCLGRYNSSWNLNKNYVNHGIKRFLCKEHEYGKRAPSGMMIGYVINNELSDIQDEVNGYLEEQFGTLPLLNFSFNDTVSRTDQMINRKKIKPNIFKLLHLWVDLRSVYIH